MHMVLTYDLGNASSSKVIHIQPETLLEGCGGPGSFEIFLFLFCVYVTARMCVYTKYQRVLLVGFITLHLTF